MTPSGSRHVAGVVPAAGASRRMGRHKALLPMGGSTFVARVVSALDEGGCSPVLVVVKEGDVPAAEEARAAGATVLENPDPGDGPLTSLRLALDALDDEVAGVVYLPVDHALVEPRHVKALLKAAERSGAPLALPVYRERRGHPAFFSRSLFDELGDPELEGGARTVVYRHLDRAALVETDDAAVVIDIDTPTKYEEALDLLASRSRKTP